jgi:hypothetical protein
MRRLDCGGVDATSRKGVAGGEDHSHALLSMHMVETDLCAKLWFDIKD